MDEIDNFYWNVARFFYGFSCAWSAVGIICNSVILWTTIKTKALRSTYNILIAVCAVGDIFDQAGTFTQLRFLFKVYYEVDSDICILLMYLPIMGISLGCTCILCVGVDRMFSVLFALWYRKLNKWLYHQVLGTIIGGFCAYITIIIAVFRRKGRVVCELWAPFPGSCILWFTGAVWVVNMASALVYIITWMSLQWHAELYNPSGIWLWRKGSHAALCPRRYSSGQFKVASSDSVAMKRVVKSLLIVGKVEIGGWISTPAMFLLLRLIGLNDQQYFAWKYATPIFAHIAIAGKLFIYYSTSTEYRSAIIAIFLKRKISQRKITQLPFVPSNIS